MQPHCWCSANCSSVAEARTAQRWRSHRRATTGRTLDSMQVVRHESGGVSERHPEKHQARGCFEPESCALIVALAKTFWTVLVYLDIVVEPEIQENRTLVSVKTKDEGGLVVSQGQVDSKYLEGRREDQNVKGQFRQRVYPLTRPCDALNLAHPCRRFKVVFTSHTSYRTATIRKTNASQGPWPPGT